MSPDAGFASGVVTISKSQPHPLGVLNRSALVDQRMEVRTLNTALALHSFWFLPYQYPFTTQLYNLPYVYSDSQGETLICKNWRHSTF